MSKGVYVICHDLPGRHTTEGLMLGTHYFRVNGPGDKGFQAVMTEIHEPRDEDGHLIGDVEYRLWVDGRRIPLDQWPETMTGQEIDQETYETMLRDNPWCERNLGVRPGQKGVDMRKLPPIAPPGR